MKKFLCILLAAILLCQLVTSAFADTSKTIGNSAEKNRTILENLQKLYGSDLTEEDVLNELSNMGLLDEQGNLNVSESIMVDGSPMTLAQVKAMLNAEGTDLGKKVSVDGTTLTLADLKKMIEIEDELARIKEKYFTNAVPFTKEHEASFNSLVSQIQGEGIQLQSDQRQMESTSIPVDPYAWIHTSMNSQTLSANTPGTSLELTFSIENTDGVPLPYDVCFSVKTLDGSARNGINYTAYDGTVIIKKGTTSSAISIPITDISNADPAERWNGDKVFYVTMSNPVNIRFYPEDIWERARDFTISLNDNYPFPLESGDTTVPTPVSISFPQGTFYSGQSIPYTIKFSEPVKVHEGTCFGIAAGWDADFERDVLKPSEKVNTKSLYLSFLFQVPQPSFDYMFDPDGIRIESISNLYDIFGNTSEYGPEIPPTTPAGAKMAVDPFYTFKELKLVDPPDDYVYDYDETVNIKLDINTSLSEWLEEPQYRDPVTGILKTVTLEVNGEFYPLETGGTGAEEGTFYTASIPAKDIYTAQNDWSTTIELCMDGHPVIDGELFHKHVAFVPKVLVTGVSIDANTYPQDNILYKTDANKLQLKAVLSTGSEVAPAFPDIKWESSDPEVAGIDEATGIIKPNKTGVVSFTAISLNGGLTDPIRSQPRTFAVKDGGPPAIVFRDGSNAFVTRENEAVKVVWGENLVGRTEGVPTEFTVQFYEGYFQNKADIYKADIAGTPQTEKVTDKNFFSVPSGSLKNITDGANPDYTVRISAANPENSSESLDAIGYIIVYPQPAKVKFDKLASYFITDASTSVDIGWTLSNYTDGSIQLNVVKNGGEYQQITPGKETSHFNLEVGSVQEGSLRDVYTVTIKAKNGSDDWSTDSFVLYVYDKDSMKIMTGGKDQSSVLLDNNEKIKTLYEEKGSQGVLDLKREIDLKENVSINYNDYPWGRVTDQIAWASDKSGTASVNYQRGSSYKNVEELEYSDYSPYIDFMLSGNAEGSVTITATHAVTGMKDTLDVTVKTLKDKLYIFNFYPRQKTFLTYTNRAGETRNLTSNEQGEIAVYEEKGIASDISLSSDPKDPENLYLGTLYKDRLVSSEKDPRQYELYPVNIFSLRRAAKVELFLKNSAGEPYSGQVTYRGAVYKNDSYCKETVENSGKTLTIGEDGRFTFVFDSTKFWVKDDNEKLTASDRLDFVFEMIFEDGYYPRLVTVNGNLSTDDTVRFGESVVNLVPCSAQDKYKPYLNSQAINYNLSSGRTIDVTNYKGSIGPGNKYPEPSLETIVAWWGDNKADGYDLKVEDANGGVIEGQKVKTLLYPFATLAYSKNITVMTPETLDLDIGEKKGAALSLYTPDGKLIKHVESPFTFINMVGAPEANDENNGVTGAVSDLNNSGNLSFSGSSSDKIIGKALSLMSGASLGGRQMNLTLLATEDPLVYRGLIKLDKSFGDSNKNETDVSIGGVEATLTSAPNEDLKGKSIKDIKNDLKDIKKNFKDKMKAKASGGSEYGATIAGYFEVEVRYDGQAGKWKMLVVGGGFDLEGFIGYTWTANAMLGPIPVTGELGVGASLKLEFRALKPYGNVPVGINAADVTDFFTALRVSLYVNAFGGFGFDFSIVAVKLGVFGEVSLDFNSEFLNRSYLTNGNDKLYGIKLSAKGRVGLRFVAKFLFWSYEAVIASVPFGGEIFRSGQPDVIEAWKDSQTSNLFNSSDGSVLNRVGAAGGSLRVVKESSGLEERDYLSLYDRSWGISARSGIRLSSTAGAAGAENTGSTGASYSSAALFASAGTSSAVNIQTNSYPYANPAVTRDGEILAFMSDSGSTDLNKTRASWTKAVPGGYSTPDALPRGTVDSDYADNNLKLDGTGDFAVAAWEHQRLPLAFGSATTDEALSIMFNSSEIVASVYDGSSNTWSTDYLTQNMVSDLAPVVAANGRRAVVAWRSVAGSELTEDKLTYDDREDSILYKVYENGAWTGPYTLYNGTSGNVKGLNASMMSDGTACVVYTLDCSGNGTGQEGGEIPEGDSSAGYETVCAVIGADKSLISDLRLTSNETVDENPQITIADFGTGEGEKFVIGWRNVNENDVSDIRFAAVDKSGHLYDGFIDSLSSVFENSPSDISSTFRFVKGERIGIEDLSLMWVEPLQDYDETGDDNAEKDCLKAVKFMRAPEGTICLTAPLDVAEMDNYTVVDHFDAYTDTKNMVKAVLLASSYTGPLVHQVGDIYTVDSISCIKYASASYTNAIDVQSIHLNYDEIRNDYRMPIQFTIANKGFLPLTSAAIRLLPDDAVPQVFFCNIFPNETCTLTAYYNIPNEMTGIHDLNYTVTAAFSNGDTNEKSGLLNLDIPDTGISKVELISDEAGKRVVQTTLNNMNDVHLAGDSNRKVFAGFYTSPDYSTGSSIGVKEIAGDDLTLLDEGALTMRFTWTVPPAGIPNGGQRLYGRIWVEEKQADGTEYSEIVEYYTSNNEKSILLPNPMEANNGNRFLVKVEQENDKGGTKAHVTVKNLSMEPSSNGNIIVSLLNEKGGILETKVLATTAGELLNLPGDSSISRTFSFAGLGAKVVAEYFTADPGSMVASISDIRIQGLDIDFDSNKNSYSLLSENLGSTVVSAVAKRPGDTVEIKAVDGTLLASGVGAAACSISLPFGRTTVNVSAKTTEAGAAPQNYIVNITNSRSANGTILLNTEAVGDNASTMILSAENLSNFTPFQWQFSKDGTWSGLYNWNKDGGNRFTVSGSGTAAVMVRVFDAKGYYMDSNTLTIHNRPSGSKEDNGGISNEDGIWIVGDIIPGGMTFTDVDADDWFREAVWYVVDAKLFNGVGKGRFAPYGNMTRGMFVTVLGRIYESRGNTVNVGTSKFSDVEKGKWYTDYVAWAEANGLLNGYGNGRFGPNDSITREQLALLIVRFTKLLGVTLPAENAAVNFNDAGRISTYASDAVQAVQRAGLMQGGTDGSFNPKGTATRAEVAAVFMRLMEVLQK